MSTKTKKTETDKPGPASKPFSLYPLSTEEALRVLLKAKPMTREGAPKSTAKKQSRKLVTRTRKVQ